MESILQHCHTYEVGGHFGGDKMTAKVLQSIFYRYSMFKNSFKIFNLCDHCQRVENISRKHEMRLNNVLVMELFDVWRIDFFLSSYSNKFILVTIDYVSKLMKFVA